MEIGTIFTGKHFKGRVEVLGIDEANNILRVSLTKPNISNGKTTSFSNWNEDWNLKHTKVGFEQGEYFLKHFKDYPPTFFDNKKPYNVLIKEQVFKTIVKASKQIRENIKNKYGGKCAYCGCDLPKSWHIDHIKPIVRNLKGNGCERPENHNVENLNPSCPSCNIVKGSLSLESFRKKISGFVTSLNRDSTQYKFAKRYGLIKETNKEVKFYFEK